MCLPDALRKSTSRNGAPRVRFVDDPGCQAAWDRYQAGRSEIPFKPEDVTIESLGFVARLMADLSRKMSDP